MKPRLVIIFILLVIAPLAALAWLGGKVIRDESRMVQIRFDEFAMQELAAVDGVVARVIDRWRRDLDRVTGLETWDASVIRFRVRKERTVRQMFVLDGDGKRVHPPESQRNQSEDAFLARTRTIWESQEAFFHPDDSDGAVPIVGGSRPPAEPSVPQSTSQSYNNPRRSGSPGFQLSSGPDSGWYTWYWGQGIHLIYWHRDSRGNVVGAELDRMALIADVLGELPNTDPDDPDVLKGRIRLADEGGAVVYEWGLRNPEKGESPRAVRGLSPPLGAWKLQYYPAAATLEADFGGGLLFGMVSGFGALVLVVLGLAVYFLREGGREIREAGERVTFVNQVSHELKTPLTNIRMYAELLEDRLADDEDEAVSGHLKVITSESQRLSRLIGNVLSFARKGRGRLAVRPVPGCVDETVSHVVDQFRPSLEAGDVKVTVELGAGGRASFDADALGQILANLLNNVEKYAASGGLVTVTTRRDGDWTLIEVSDQGPGIPDTVRDKVFQPFYRVSGRVSDGVTGTGIGLSISRDLARLHGGDLTLVPCDVGACFRVTLHTPGQPSKGV